MVQEGGMQGDGFCDTAGSRQGFATCGQLCSNSQESRPHLHDHQKHSQAVRPRLRLLVERETGSAAESVARRVSLCLRLRVPGAHAWQTGHEEGLCSN